jgi:diaminopimelate epimerase
MWGLFDGGRTMSHGPTPPMSHGPTPPMSHELAPRMSRAIEGLPFAKGHGTGNDFVIVPDPDGKLALSADLVAALCDRRRGLGGDGLLRVVRTRSHAEVSDRAAEAEWFMDYRNADGSIAEMCGNGVRVMARYLWSVGLAHGRELPIGTRGGLRLVHKESDLLYTVDMGRPEVMPTSGPVRVTARRAVFEAVAIRAPNPHAVVFVDDLGLVGPLVEAPTLEPASVFPDGANVEFVENRGGCHIALRVWERGVGETRSCGTGVCAAAWATMRREGSLPGSSYTVDVPGGRLVVTERDDGTLLLTGPAELGVVGEIALDRL